MAGGNYRKLKSGAWHGRVTINGIPYSVTRATKELARNAISELELTHAPKDSTRGRAAGRNLTVTQVIEAWFARHARNLAPGTVKDYRRVIDNHILTADLATLPVRRLHQSDLNDFYDTLETSIGPARIRRVHNIISTAMTYAVRMDIIPANPCAKADPPRVTDRDIDPPTPTEVVKIISVADTIREGMSMFVHLAAVTGARRGELVALRWSDYAEGVLTIGRSISTATGDHGVGTSLIEKDTKTHAVRRLAIDAGAQTALETHAAWQVSEAERYGIDLIADPRLFAADPDGALPWRPEAASRWFAKAVKAAEVRPMRLHDIRHAAATQMMAAGVDVRTGAGRLGHKRSDTYLNRYAHVVPAADQAASDKLGEIYRLG